MKIGIREWFRALCSSEDLSEFSMFEAVEDEAVEIGPEIENEVLIDTSKEDAKFMGNYLGEGKVGE